MEEHDAAVQQTCNDAAVCKNSASLKGYINDPYIRHFLKRTDDIKMPIMNRGYYARVKAIQKIMDNFIEMHQDKVQFLILGAGNDTTYFRLANELTPAQLARVNYVEIDFPQITRRKNLIYKKKPELAKALGFSSPLELGSSDVDLTTDNYSIVGCDLRNLDNVKEKLEKQIDFSIPTMVISECVLVYIETLYSEKLLKWFSTKFSAVAIAVYEQILPNDAFGQIMIKNIQARGCDLKSIHDFPTIESQRARFLKTGYDIVECFDMNDVYYRFLETGDRRRIEKLEIFDELEEFHLLQAHYCIVLASNTLDLKIRLFASECKNKIDISR